MIAINVTGIVKQLQKIIYESRNKHNTTAWFTETSNLKQIPKHYIFAVARTVVSRLENVFQSPKSVMYFSKSTTSDGKSTNQITSSKLS